MQISGFELGGNRYHYPAPCPDTKRRQTIEARLLAHGAYHGKGQNWEVIFGSLFWRHPCIRKHLIFNPDWIVYMTACWQRHPIGGDGFFFNVRFTMDIHIELYIHRGLPLGAQRPSRHRNPIGGESFIYIYIYMYICIYTYIYIYIYIYMNII